MGIHLEKSNKGSKIEPWLVRFMFFYMNKMTLFLILHKVWIFMMFDWFSWFSWFGYCRKWFKQRRCCQNKLLKAERCCQTKLLKAKRCCQNKLIRLQNRLKNMKDSSIRYMLMLVYISNDFMFALCIQATLNVIYLAKKKKLLIWVIIFVPNVDLLLCIWIDKYKYIGAYKSWKNQTNMNLVKQGYVQIPFLYLQTEWWFE